MSLRPPARATKLLAGVLLGLGFVLATASVASAHVDFVGSAPANVSTVAGPISKVTLEYSGAADPIASEFSITDASGSSVAIESVSNDGAAKVVVTSKAPLPNGRNKVSWALRGADGHKMTGTISFTVAASTPSTTSTTISAAGGSTTVAPPTTAPTATQVDDAASVPSSTPGSSADLAEKIATVGRWIVYAAALFVIGGLAYLVWVHRGPRREGRRIVFLIRRGALLVVVGSIIEWFAQLAAFGSGSVGDLVSPSAWGDLLASSFAIGTILRIVGGILVLRFVAIDVVSEDPIDFANLDDLDIFGELSGSGTGGVELADPPRSSHLARVRVESGPLAFVGAVLLIVSEAFIGHTASVEPRALMVVSDAVHMTAGGIWVAGVWLLTWTLWQRRRRGEPLDAQLLAVKFSLVATWSLVAVGITGLALAWAILDSLGALWSTGFGRLLILKVVVVAVIAAFGLHNRRLVPELESSGSDARFFRTIAIEAVLFVVVLAVTSLLVVSNPLS